MSGMGMLMMAGAPNLVMSGLGAQLLNTSSAGPGVRSASFTLASDGSIVYSAGSGSARWYQQSVAGIGSSYWVRYTVGSSASSSTTGPTVWISLSAGQTWSASNTPMGAEGIGNGTFQIAADSGGVNVVGGGSFSWDVGYAP